MPESLNLPISLVNFLSFLQRKRTRFQVYYHAPNKRMTSGGYLIPKPEGIFDDVKIQSVFRTLDIFAGVWLVKLASQIEEGAAVLDK